MKHGTTCKFCKLPITLDIDDAYAVLGDPFKLLRLAACNSCSALRTERRRLEGMIQRQCAVVEMLNYSKSKIPDRITEILTELTQHYARMVANWNNSEGMLWDEGIVISMLKAPKQWGDILGRLWRMFKEWKASQAQQELMV